MQWKLIVKIYRYASISCISGLKIGQLEVSKQYVFLSKCI